MYIKAYNLVGLIIFIIKCSTAYSQNNSDSISSRLIATVTYVSYDSTSNINDSTVYNYNNSNGGDLNHILKYSKQEFYNFDNLFIFRNNESVPFISNYITSQTFDTNQNIVTQTTKKWDYVLKKYSNATRKFYTYNSKNNCNAIIFQEWDSANYNRQWVNYFKDISLYDSNNNLIASEELAWDTINDKWKNQVKYIYTYDLHNNDTLELSLNWNDFNWDTVPLYQNVYRYNANGQDTTKIEIDYNFTSHSWDSSSKTRYIYGKNNLDSLELLQNWNSLTNSWDNLCKYLYYYDKNKNTILYIKKNWNLSPLGWTDCYENRYTYNNFNQITSSIDKCSNNCGIRSKKMIYYYQKYKFR